MYNLICKLSVHSRHVPGGLFMGFWQLSVGRQLILETSRPLWQPNSWKSGWLKRTGSSYSAWTFYTLVLSPSRLVTTKADVLTGGLLLEKCVSALYGMLPLEPALFAIAANSLSWLSENLNKVFENNTISLQC